ncbi:MAG: YhcH/YjgK/YiaL family protein [Candidatus Gastranaerophilales bacterium]
MIFDDIRYLSQYIKSEEILDFVNNLDKNVAIGKHIINENVYANVDAYMTKPLEDCLLEAHEKFIDIQILIDGEEQINFINIDGLNEASPYDSNRDIVFFETPKNKLSSVMLNNKNFAIFYPQDAHMPQIAIENGRSKVKKVVVKIRINNK